ncbi:hypothetical protein IAQ61_003921 [Plenodomus lingam]|nr:hypothetical protein IAQ61_003921 [Plenodomus lingam]
MVKCNSLLALSAFSLGTLAHPTTKHTDDLRFCSFEERNIFARHELTTRATIRPTKTWNPPANMVKALDQVWETATLKENPGVLGNKNWIFDKIMANNGKINYCVWWNHAGKSTPEVRAKIEKALQNSLRKWTDVLVGFEGFPFTTLDVKVTRYAVQDRSVLEGDMSGLEIHQGPVDPRGWPDCDLRCYRAEHLDGDYSECPGGAKNRYDMMFWIEDSLGARLGGSGLDWGQELGPDYVLKNLENPDMHILDHEVGHSWGLQDFYTWLPEGQESFLMNAGSATEITEFDAWMLRDWWRRLKPIRGW